MPIFPFLSIPPIPTSTSFGGSGSFSSSFLEASVAPVKPEVAAVAASSFFF